MTRYRTWALSIAGLAVIGAVATLLLSGPSFAGKPTPKPKDLGITWSPASIAVTLKPGESTTTTAFIVAREGDDDALTVYASTSLKDIVSVSPTSFKKFRRNQTVAITVVIKQPILAQPGTTTGFIQLYEQDGKKKKKKSEPVGKQIPVSVTTLCPCLPPDPGVAGNATVAGIDSDNDGVRDDVQRFVAITWPDHLADGLLVTRDMQYIITQQGTPLTPTEKTAAFCALAQGRINDSVLSPVVLNTEARWQAYTAHVGFQTIYRCN